MTSAITPSKPHGQLQTNQPQPSSQAPITPASPPSKRADLKSWWKKFQVQPTRHQEARGKRSSSYLAWSSDLSAIILLNYIMWLSKSCARSFVAYSPASTALSFFFVQATEGTASLRDTYPGGRETVPKFAPQFAHCYPWHQSLYTSPTT